MEKMITERDEKSVCSSDANTDKLTDTNGKESEMLHNWSQPKKEGTETEPSVTANKSDDGQEERMPTLSDNKPAQRELPNYSSALTAPAESPKEAVVEDKLDTPDKSKVDLKNMWQKINLMDKKNQRRREEHKNSYCGKQQNANREKLPSGDVSNVCLSSWECEEEKEFEMHFKEWEKQFETWKKQNKDHPDRTGFDHYEKQWHDWKERLLRRRDQVRRLRSHQKLLEKE